MQIIIVYWQCSLLHFTIIRVLSLLLYVVYLLTSSNILIIRMLKLIILCQIVNFLLTNFSSCHLHTIRLYTSINILLNNPIPSYLYIHIHIHLHRLTITKQLLSDNVSRVLVHLFNEVSLYYLHLFLILLISLIIYLP